MKITFFRLARFAVYSALFFPAALHAQPPVTLTFDQPQTAGISGFRVLWDTPVVLDENGAIAEVDKGQFGKAPSAFWFPAAKARDGGSKPGGLAFDAVHRSLLVRFPGAAQRIAAQMAQGYLVQKAELVLPFRDTELWAEGYAEPAGMSFLGRQWADWKPRWHAVAWALRKPWSADAKIGPTFNAAINGTLYWTKYGAGDDRQDRFPARFGPAEVSAEHPDGRLDVTGELNDPAFGAMPGARLSALENNGFLVKKEETYDAALWKGSYEWQTMTGPRGILIHTPQLVVTFAPGPRTSVSPSELAVQPAQSGGHPTAILPSGDELKALTARLSLVRPESMPAWQWARVQEMIAYGGAHLFPDTPKAYEDWIDDQLARAPRSWRGFDAPAVVENYFKNLDALPEPVRDHWKLYWWSWLLPDRDYVNGFDFNGKHYEFAQGYIGGNAAQAYYKETGDWQGNFSLYRTYCYAEGTMNFNNWNAIGTLGGGIILNSPMLINDGRHGIEAFSFRLWSWFDGTTQESIDHYYMAESMTAQKVIQDFSPTPYERMMGESIVTKSVEELASAYHPNLRRFISSSGRTGIAYLLGTQEGTMHVMHVLSRKGALTDTAPANFTPKDPSGAINAPNVQELPVFGHNLAPGRVAQQQVDSPWAPEWMSDVVDDKPLPYYATNDFKMWGNFSATPMWKCSYLGRDYGLATLDVTTNETVPFMAQWRRTEEPVTSMTQIGTLLARAGINRTEFLESITHGGKQHNPNGIVGAQGHLQFALQHKNKAIVLTSPVDQLKVDGGRPVPDQVTSLQTSLALFNFERTPSWELYVDGQRVTQFPFKAKLSQRITIHDGVTFIGLIPLPATDLGRDTEVEFAADGVLTELQGGGKAREALRINLYNLKSATPLDKATIDWKKIDKAYNGFVVELGDTSEYPDFAAFQKHIADATLDATWDDAKGVLAVAYKSGDDLLECGFNPTAKINPTTEVFPYRRVNGAWPYNPPGIDRDTTLTQQGTTGKLEKNGAALRCEPGRMAYLVTDAKSDIVSGYNPFPDLTEWSLSAPGGVSVMADGQVGMTRVTLQPAQNKIWVNYSLNEEQKARQDLATSLIVTGFKGAPAVEFNGVPLKEAPMSMDLNGQTAYVIQLGNKPPDLNAIPARYREARQSLGAP